MQPLRLSAREMIGTAVASLVMTFVLYGMIVVCPMVTYELFSPAPSKECKQVQVGMTRREVLAVIHQATSPFGEYSGDNQIVFSRAANACVVVFDPEKSTVTNVRTDPTLKTGTIAQQQLSQ